MAKDAPELPDRQPGLTQRQRWQKWATRRDIPLTYLAWSVFIILVFWLASHITKALLMLAIAALFAFALAPLVKLLQRVMPRIVAILVVYLIVLSAFSLLGYMTSRATITQTHDLLRYMQSLTERHGGQPTQLERSLVNFGITRAQINEGRQFLLTRGEEFTRDAIPFLRSFLEFLIDTIIVAILSIYLLIDGTRVIQWLRRNTPQAARANFLLDTLQRVVGGYIRGQFILALLISVLVGLGMGFIFHLPYAFLLGILAFIMAFIPVLGTFISGAVCILIALTQSWVTALLVLVYFVFIHVIEGEVVGPRIVGKSVGLHPIVSLFALVAGGELFGIWGTLFASPIAGVLQTIIIVLWGEWRTRHPDQFAQTKGQVKEAATGE
ncbi:AI-2E family transporter [Ktedonobacter sp. SOSP1-52]|uniref:AI-2E family transporter n=1 Tax=Ktedonobacter sp. SOSP1-52 TaxID=2778366 RepID=UPI001915A1D9|nr:AI-2E family transporter [Ktedonobacter sp. SOSP1-52]GHO68572.1 AI-2E family transporter [Ktedonobacter sp. SOSP1-52]